uniref:Kazrin, periplakin interacting protein n=2 Tax=Sus scrofa TaxID=9823 RepID=A0A8D1QQ50_PIG
MRAADSGTWERVRQLAAQGESAPSCGAGAGPARPSGPIACEPGADAAGPSDRPRAGAPSVRADGDCSQPALLREEVSRLQEEVHLLRQMKEMLMKDLEESQGGKSSEVLSATELRVQLAQKEQELARAKEALQAMKADRKRLKGEKTDLVSQMQQLYATLESREEQLRDFIRNYEQHRKESEDAVKALAKEKDLLEREKWELRRQAKEATDHATALRSQLDLKDNRMKELEAELAMAKQSLATLTKDVPKRHSLAMPGETVLNGNQEWVVQADLPLTAAIRQSQQTLYHSHPPHPADRQAVRVSPCHSRQPSVISDASAAEGDRSSTPSDINSPRHRTHSLCNGDSPGPVQKNLHNPIVQSLEDLEDQKRKKKKEKMGFGSISRVFARGKQRKSLDPGLFDDSDSQCSPTRQSLSLSEGEEQMDRLQQVELVRTTPMSHWKAGTVQAWLEVVMAMPMYVKACAENVKSGKVGHLPPPAPHRGKASLPSPIPPRGGGSGGRRVEELAERLQAPKSPVNQWVSTTRHRALLSLSILILRMGLTFPYLDERALQAWSVSPGEVAGRMLPALSLAAQRAAGWRGGSPASSRSWRP